jgi:signal transduction histidine kinase
LFFSEKEGGMGVGLNVVQEIVSAHGGKLLLKNHPQGGGCVEVTLPQLS